LWADEADGVIAIPAGQIPGVPPAVSGQAFGIEFGTVPVAETGHGSADNQFAHLAGAHHGASVIYHLGLHHGRRAAAEWGAAHAGKGADNPRSVHCGLVSCAEASFLTGDLGPSMDLGGAAELA